MNIRFSQGYIVIVGNGFDLSHNMKTSYNSFVSFIISEHKKVPMSYSSLIDWVGRHRAVNHPVKEELKFKNKLLYRIYLGLKKKKWCDVEQDYFNLLMKRQTTDSAIHLNKEFNEIKDALEEYLVIQNSQSKQIDSYKYLYDNFENHTLVLNFNYTSTLDYYKTNKTEVVNIHGELKNEENPIIFGYAADNSEISKLMQKNENSYLENIKRFQYTRNNNYNRLKEFIKQCQSFKVLILGHSCGRSDKLILNDVLGSEKCKEIYIFYHKGFDDFRDRLINIERITENYSISNKVDTFENSLKMPQHDEEPSLT